LHSKVNPSKDQQLAQEFDRKLKLVMESLSETVNDERNVRWVKIDKAFSSKVELLDTCCGKLALYFKDGINK
jgi:hypothetical protein